MEQFLILGAIVEASISIYELFNRDLLLINVQFETV